MALFFAVIREDRDGDFDSIELFDTDTDAVEYISKMIQEDAEYLEELLRDTSNIEMEEVPSQDELYEILIDGLETVTYNEVRYTVVKAFKRN